MMTAMTPNETARIWRSQRREAGLQLYLSRPDGEQAAFVGSRVANLPIDLRISPADAWIDVEQLQGAAAAVVEVDGDAPASIARFETLAAKTATPLIAAAYDPPLALVRTLLRHGARDVLPLPLDPGDLQAALEAINRAAAATGASAPVRTSKLVSVIKSRGGASRCSPVAVRFAEHEAAAGREVAWSTSTSRSAMRRSSSGCARRCRRRLLDAAGGSTRFGASPGAASQRTQRHCRAALDAAGSAADEQLIDIAPSAKRLARC